MGVTGMFCLKCGKEFQEAGVFCADCLEEMRAFPVKQDAVIHIPVRPALPVEKPERKRKGYADHVRALRRTIRALCVVIAVLTLLVCLLCAVVYQQYPNIQDIPAIGKNYSTSQQVDP